MKKQINIDSLSQIDSAAAEFLSLIKNAHCIAFYGSMGAGKTTFITALCRQMGVTDPVNSPTFTLVNEYRSASGRSIYHFDFYRIKKTEEVFDIGYEEYIDSPGLCLMEWPELIEDLLPEDVVKVQIEVLPQGGRVLKLDL